MAIQKLDRRVGEIVRSNSDSERRQFFPNIVNSVNIQTSHDNILAVALFIETYITCMAVALVAK